VPGPRDSKRSNTDFLLCAVAHRHAMPIFTDDGDFARYSNNRRRSAVRALTSGRRI